jgi:hypothetical protein
MALIGSAVILSPSGKAWGPVWKTAPATKRSPLGLNRVTHLSD